jgi:ATP-dependent Clp protease ATP-binding subunit ClpX
MEKSMLDIMYEVPSQSDIREVAVSEEVIVSGEKPLIVYEKEEEKAELA